MKRLLDVLREDLHLTGTKEGCGEGECGSCSVRMNGELVNSCLVPVLQAEGAAIQTVEGLALDGELHPLQQAFLQHGGAQCGICTPGMLMAAAQLLAHTPSPQRWPRFAKALAGNLCRCTGFMRIFESVAAAAGELNQETASASTRGSTPCAVMPAMHDLVAPGSLGAVLDLLAAEPGKWTPIAGGTELMVAFSAGRLAAPKLVSLWGIRRSALHRDNARQSIVIGAAATFLDLRGHAVIAADLPLLAQALQAGSAPLPTRAAPRLAEILSMARRPQILRRRCWPTTQRSR